MVASERPSASPSAAPRLPHVPIRTCVACRRKAAQHTLLRVAAPSGTVEVQRRGPGRGAYLCPEPQCLEQALRRGGVALAKALRCPKGRIAVDEEELAAEMARAAHDDARREE